MGSPSAGSGAQRLLLADQGISGDTLHLLALVAVTATRCSFLA